MRISTSLWFTLLLMFGAGQWAVGQDKSSQIILQPHKSYPNIVSVSPLPMTALEGATYFGAGIEYERFFDRKCHFSMNIPLFGGSIGLQKEFGKFYAVSPGFKYHPAGNKHKLDFSFGPQLMIGSEKYAFREGDMTQWVTIIGPMLQTDLNWNIRKHGLVGAHLAIGEYDYGASIPGVAIQLGIKVGGYF